MCVDDVDALKVASAGEADDCTMALVYGCDIKALDGTDRTLADVCCATCKAAGDGNCIKINLYRETAFFSLILQLFFRTFCDKNLIITISVSYINQKF